jgi:AcrR family transcriptional regulator
MRAIAADAGVDAALVHHYFRNKAELFAATLSLPEDATERILAALRSPAPGEKIVREFLDAWDAAVGGSGLAALMRTAEPGAERRLSELIAATIVTPVTGAIGAAPGLPRLRAALVAAHLTGLAWLRYVMKAEPVASASSALLARTYGPAVSVTLAP